MTSRDLQEWYADLCNGWRELDHEIELRSCCGEDRHCEESYNPLCAIVQPVDSEGQYQLDGYDSRNRWFAHNIRKKKKIDVSVSLPEIIIMLCIHT